MKHTAAALFAGSASAAVVTLRQPSLRSRSVALVGRWRADDRPIGNYGDTRCPCIGFDRVEGETMVTFTNGTEVAYPADLGARCEAWDDDRNPSCKDDVANPLVASGAHGASNSRCPMSDVLGHQIVGPLQCSHVLLLPSDVISEKLASEYFIASLIPSLSHSACSARFPLFRAYSRPPIACSIALSSSSLGCVLVCLLLSLSVSFLMRLLAGRHASLRLAPASSAAPKRGGSGITLPGAAGSGLGRRRRRR